MFVEEPENELILHGIDTRGARATSQYWIANTEVDPAGGAAAALGAALQAISNNWIFSVEILRHATQNADVVPTEGPYQRPSDKAMIVLQGEDGSPVTMQIPAPNETIFQDDAITVDPADAAMDAFLDYVKANLKTSEGAAIRSYVRGYRRRPPGLKKQ